MKLGTEVGPVPPACHSCLIPFPPHSRLCEVQFDFSTQDREQSGVSLSSSQSPIPAPSNNNQLQLTLVLGGQASQPPKTTLNRKEKLNNKIRSQKKKKECIQFKGKYSWSRFAAAKANRNYIRNSRYSILAMLKLKHHYLYAYL